MPQAPATGRAPIIYFEDADIRFGDLDPYGHLNAKHYLDLVASTRLLYLDRKLNFPISKITALGYGFYLRSCEQHFRRPIVGVCRVHVRSWVPDFAGVSLPVQYQILNEAEDLIYADGRLLYVLINLKTSRPAKPPPWMSDLFLYQEGEKPPVRDPAKVWD